MIHGSGSAPGEGSGYPLQYSCLGNPKERGAWWVTVHSIARVRPDVATNHTTTTLMKPQIFAMSSKTFLISFSTTICLKLCIHSVQFSRSVMSDSLGPHESQHARPPCPSPTPGVHSDSGPSNQWCHPAISSSVIPFSSCPQSLPASESFPMSQVFS